MTRHEKVKYVHPACYSDFPTPPTLRAPACQPEGRACPLPTVSVLSDPDFVPQAKGAE